MKNPSRRVILFVAFGLAVGGAILLWQHGKPRVEALRAVSQLADDLASHRGPELLKMVVIPAAISSQTQDEQQQFLTKALADEISPEGVEALKSHAEFGSLKSIFPAQALIWSSQAAVNADDCIAFKMERAGIRAEVVVLHVGQTYRIIRCVNVKQMASEKSPA